MGLSCILLTLIVDECRYDNMNHKRADCKYVEEKHSVIKGYRNKTSSTVLLMSLLTSKYSFLIALIIIIIQKTKYRTPP